MRANSIADYYASIVSQIAASNIVPDLYNRIKYAASSKEAGIIRTNPELVFRDGARLRFTADIRIVDGEVKQINYSFGYHYEEEYFRYDKDPEREAYPSHALCHLQVNKDDPRYITHETNFAEVFRFIQACFYS